MKNNKYISYSEEETKKIAAQIFDELGGGDIVGLTGDLGVGKTLFVKGLMESLNPSIVVQSPTFVIRNDYPCTNFISSGTSSHKNVKKIIHIDLFRLDLVTKENDEFLEGVGDKDTITFIEWPERLHKEYISKSLKKKMVNITIDFGENDSRIIIIQGLLACRLQGSGFARTKSGKRVSPI